MNPLSLFGYHRVLVLGGALLLAACASPKRLPLDMGERMERPPAPLRTQLVLLNIPEASGWIAYRDEGVAPAMMEDYRIVVIRQSNGDIMYDSVIPLTAGLATHGFELPREDPRLETLARRVDRDIIAPLESVMDSETAESPEAVMDSDPDESSPDKSSMEETSGLEEPSAPAVAEETVFQLEGREGGTVRIRLRDGATLAPGQQVFAREPDRTLEMENGDDLLLLSKGAVTGLLEVQSVEGNLATATLLSGSVSENAYFELSSAGEDSGTGP